MPRFAPNLAWLWTELDPYERFHAAQRAGFRRVELQFPQKLDLSRVLRALDDTGLEVVLFNQLAEDGILSDSSAKDQFLESIRDTLALAQRIGTKRIHLAYGAARPAEARAAEQVIIGNLKRAAALAQQAGAELLIEPINQKDRPDIYPDTLERALTIVQAVAEPGIGIQLDTYHAAVNGEDSLHAIREYLPLIRHVQVSDFPGRHEPGTGTLPLDALFRELDRVDYAGSVGLEYRPIRDTEAGLLWLPLEDRA